MPFCPECKTEYEPGFTQCADCQAPLVESLPPEMPSSPTSEDMEWVRVLTDHDEAEAFVLKGYLESEGIECMLENNSIHFDPTTATTLVNLFVRKDQVEQAQNLLHEKEYLYKCSNCGAFCSLSDKT